MAQYNLPPQPTSFIGRAQDIVDIRARLADDSCRLLTLIGPGGIGKTRLALEVAGHYADAFMDGVYFVPLQPLSNPDYIVPAIADAIGLSFNTGKSQQEQLTDCLKQREMLLVLDNFEHLVNGAGLLSEMLLIVPKVQLMVTSRERLNLLEEWVFDVRELSYPDDDRGYDAESYDAVRLFLERTRQLGSQTELNESSWAAVKQICQLVGGMPLGIELAATWSRTLSPAGIVDELRRGLDVLQTSTRNMELRHRDIRTLFDSMWQQLGENERRMFAALSVFRGGFTREAAEHVTDASLRTLSALVDRSLIRLDDGALRHP